MTAVAFFGTYDRDYPRTAVLLRGLRERGVTVREFHAPLPPLAAAEMVGAAGAARLAAALAAAHVRLALQHPRRLDVDALVVGYPGHLLVPYGWLVARLRRVRLVFDPLVSLADTFAGDRALVAAASPLGRLAAASDAVAFRLPDLVLADTWAHAAHYQRRFGLSRSRVAVVPVGALPEPRADGAPRRPGRDEPLVVFQYGKWSPLHGADVVLAAARLLRGEPFRFELAGEGQLSAALRARIAADRLDNVAWLGALTPAALRARTLAADVCLGVFGTSAKAARVVPNKVYDALACGRPLVTADTPGVRELLHDGEDALLVPAGDAAALAAALRRLRDEGERGRLGAAALALYRRRCTPAAVAGSFLAALGCGGAP